MVTNEQGDVVMIYHASMARRTAVLVSLATALAAAPAMAQDAPTADPDADGGEIIVTGQKMGAQSVLTVPVSITAIDAETLNDAGLNGLSDISKLAPSVNLVESFGRAANYLSIRGVSSTETGTPTVQVFVDGFTTGIPTGAINTTLFDIDRVEILEGPQATLYGANAIGGVINYITKKPGDDMEASLRLSAADYGEASAIGSVSGPVVPGILAAGAAVAYHRRDGFLRNVATGDQHADSQEDISARAALRATLGATTIDLTSSYNHTNDDCGDCSYIPDSFPLTGAANDTSLRDGLVDTNEFSRNIDQLGPQYLHRTGHTEVLTIEHDFGDAVLTSITGYGAYDTDIAFDLSRAASRSPGLVTYVISNTQDEAYSQELRLAGGAPGAFNWLIGGYYLHSTQESQTYLGVLLPNPINLQDIRTKNYALFANVSLPLGSFVVSGGLRYDHQEVASENPLFALAGKSKSNEVLPRVTAEYHFGDNMMFYATASKGYKSGGVNVGTPDPVAPRTYAPEFLWNYEAGLKGKLFDNRLIFTLAAFRMDWTDRQVQLLDTSGLLAYQANLGTSHINGAELGLTLNAGPAFSLSGSLTYLDGKIDRYIDESGVSDFYSIDPDLHGNRLPNAPKLRASLSPQFVTPISGGYKLRARADVAYTGERYFDAQNLLRQDEYALVNLYIGIENDHFEIGAFANNLFDQGYHSAGNLTTLGPLMTTGSPRWIGVRSRIKL